MKEYLPKEYTFAQALTTCCAECADSSKKTEKLNTEKVEALRTAYAILRSYEEEHFDSRLLDCIMEKKAAMILAATAIKDVKEIAQPPKPYYNGNEFVLSANSVPEEELICWSKASLGAPLNSEAYARFRKLFEAFYGVNVDDL